ncbi:MAG: PKD domain-containing protein, partial [Desulfamplus sp.]|nr:PKD domain-containing protein [Desulfamplus sp.]
MLIGSWNRVFKNIVFIIFVVLFAVFGVLFCRSEVHAAPPVVVIDLPFDNSEVEFGDSILFSATVVDPDGDDIDSYLWNSPQGTLSTESTFTTSKLTVGTRLITLAVTDVNGEKGYANVTITVQPSAPTIRITKPVNGSSYPYNAPLITTTGDYVVFEATATDAQDDPEDIKITWRSSIDQEFGSGDSVSPVTLSAGSHLIEVTATDSDGNVSTDSISITVKNQPPAASISLPADNASFSFGDLVTFMGSGTDPEEGKLTGDALVWTSSQGDLIGKGEVVASNSLKSGINIITLTVTDSGGGKATASVTITIGNAPPRAEITSPDDGSAFAFRETITFKGTGVDNEDGTLPVSSLVWTSSSSSVPLGKGNSLSVSNLPSGTHTITLTVTDSEGATATDQVVVVVGNTAPVPVITSPANNSSHSFGRAVLFSGSASDA